ncbi:hypothetical protein EJB05_55955, partial [Eragrostis curvula]
MVGQTHRPPPSVSGDGSVYAYANLFRSDMDSCSTLRRRPTSSSAASCRWSLESTLATQSLHPCHNADGVDEKLLVQVTRFTCGSYVVGYTFYHLFADGYAALQPGSKCQKIDRQEIRVAGNCSCLAWIK